jgi:hypothetical protein
MNVDEAITVVLDHMALSGDEPLVRYALTYAAVGLEVFPLNPATKSPFTKAASQYRATTEQAIIAEWWGQWPNALIGHRIEVAQVLLDIDPRHNGLATWDLLEDTYGPFQIGRVHYSGRGDDGFHAWFLRPDLPRISAKRLHLWAREHEVGQPIVDERTGETVRWTSGIDLLHRRWRYTILPPSPHPSNGQPYRWRIANGVLTPVPEALAALLVPLEGHGTEDEDGDANAGRNGVDDDRPSSVPLRDFEHADSIADWFSDAHSWRSILEPHRWTLAEGDGDGDGSLWRHPIADGAHTHSASIRHGCLFVYSDNTVFEQTEEGGPNGYTKFRAWALLEHGGDLSAAARAARALKLEADRRLSDPPRGDETPPPHPSTLFVWSHAPDPFVLTPIEWLIEGLWCRDTHGELAGPQKSLKSALSMWIDVGLAAGVAVLGRWPVARPERVLHLAGEGGAAGFWRRFGRVCAAYGIEIGDVRPNLKMTTATAALNSTRFVDSLRAELNSFGPALVHLDPYYAYAATGADPRQLVEVGAALERLDELCRDYGASLLLNNHFNQTGSGAGLTRITGAGHGEWVDSWLLVKHRRAPDVDGGRFWLRLDVGSRQWGGGMFDIDMSLGRFDAALGEHIGALTYRVTRATVDSEQGERDSIEYGKAVGEIVAAWRRRRERVKTPWTQAEWLGRCTGARAALRRAFLMLVDDGRIVEVALSAVDSRGRSISTKRFRLVESQFEQGAAT